jgi:hypothetical protein
MEDFPEQADYIQGLSGRASLIKIDIFKGLMFYSLEVERGRPRVIALAKEQVKEAILANKSGQKLDLLTLHAVQEYIEVDEEDRDYEFADGTGEIELPTETKKKRNRGRRNPGRSGKGPQSTRGSKESGPSRSDQSRSQRGGKRDNNKTSDNRNKNRK